eukprot:COSAG06_NODE_63590_length_262_cov_0.527607_1_plen_64_part_10
MPAAPPPEAGFQAPMPLLLGLEPSGTTPKPLLEGFQPVRSPTFSGASIVHCAAIIRASRSARSS